MYGLVLYCWFSPAEDEEDEMEKMLSELTLISPPSSAPLLSSLHSEGGEEGSGSSNSLDSLTLKKKRLLDTMEPTEADPTETSLDCRPQDGASEDRGDGGKGRGTDSLRASSTTAINIEPPTPTTPGQRKSLAEREVDRTSPCAGGGLLGDSLKSGLSDDDLLPSTDLTTCADGSASPGRGSPRQSPPYFSPASLQNSPSSSNTVRNCVRMCVCTYMYMPVCMCVHVCVCVCTCVCAYVHVCVCVCVCVCDVAVFFPQVDDWVRRLEGSVKQWALQIISALEHLHSNGIICK